MKWLEDNLVLLLLIVLAFLLFATKVGGLLSSFGSLFGSTANQNPADLATAANHLHRPEKLPDGSSASAQKAYAERMQVYNAALTAHALFSVMDRSIFTNYGEYGFFGNAREQDIMKLLRTAISAHVTLSSLEAEYTLFAGKRALLVDLQACLSPANYRWFVSNITSK